MMRRCSVVILVALVLALVPAWGFEGLEPTHKHFGVQTRVFRIISQYWSIQNLFFQMIQDHSEESEAAYLRACEIYEKQNVDFGKVLLSAAADKEREVMSIISDIYKSHSFESRQALYPALAILRFDVLQGNKSLTEDEFREYFPGYGYTEPGYKYRKGRELSREFKGFHWQQEEVSISTTWNVTLTVNIDVLAILQGWLTGGLIKNLQVSEQFTMNVNGQPMICFNVSFQRVKAITTKTNRKFEVNKIWFELQRAKISGWSTGPFEPCGKTYEILHEPTGEEVVTNISTN
jgi:hypothetical protein